MTLTICAVGDIMLGEQPLCYGFGVKSVIEEKGVDYLFSNVREILKRGDIVFGNLEAPISRHTVKKGYDANFFRAEPDVVEGLKDANFSVLSVANNHIMEHGEDAFLSTLRCLEENNIVPVGVKNKPRFLKINGYKLGILGYSFVEDFVDNVLYNKVHSEEEVLKEVSHIRDFVDLIIVSLHWGHEYIPFPSPRQLRIARKIIDYGADIILGTHPHVIQSYEIYKGKPIIYSLGNFVFDQTYIKNTQKSMVAKIEVNIDTKDADVEIIPVILDPKEYYPRIAERSDRDGIFHIISSTRKMVENNFISDYISKVGDYSTLASKYERLAKEQMKIHFIKNIYRFPLRFVAHMVYTHFKKRWRHYQQ